MICCTFVALLVAAAAGWGATVRRLQDWPKRHQRAVAAALATALAGVGGSALASSHQTAGHDGGLMAIALQLCGPSADSRSSMGR